MCVRVRLRVHVRVCVCVNNWVVEHGTTGVACQSLRCQSPIMPGLKITYPHKSGHENSRTVERFCVGFMLGNFTVTRLTDVPALLHRNIR